MPSSSVQICARYGDYCGGGDLCVRGRSYAATCVRVGGLGSLWRKSASIRVRRAQAGGRAGGLVRRSGDEKAAPEGGALVRGAAAGVAVLPVDGGGRKMNGAIAGAFAAPAAYAFNYMYIYVYTSVY